MIHGQCFIEQRESFCSLQYSVYATALFAKGAEGVPVFWDKHNGRLMWFCDANGAIQWHKPTEQFQILSLDSAELGNEEESDSSEEGSTLSLKKQLSVSIKPVSIKTVSINRYLRKIICINYKYCDPPLYTSPILSSNEV